MAGSPLAGASAEGAMPLSGFTVMELGRTPLQQWVEPL